MITLTRVISDHWHAVERDLLSLGFHADDIGPKLSVWELVSIVVAAPPGSAVFQHMGGYSKTDELLANLGEQQAGLIQLNSRYARPGVEPGPPRATSGFQALPAWEGAPFTAMPIDELIAKREAMAADLRAKAGVS